MRNEPLTKEQTVSMSTAHLLMEQPNLASFAEVVKMRFSDLFDMGVTQGYLAPFGLNEDGDMLYVVSSEGKDFMGEIS